MSRKFEKTKILRELKYANSWKGLKICLTFFLFCFVLDKTLVYRNFIELSMKGNRIQAFWIRN